MSTTGAHTSGIHAITGRRAIGWGMLAVTLPGLLGLLGAGCRTSRESPPTPQPQTTQSSEEQPPDRESRESRMTAMRHDMVAEQIAARGVKDPAVLRAMRTVPRHEFVPAPAQARAYEDRPLSIGHDQTISQPYIVAAMTELARLDADSRVLEIGTGSGYQTAVLAEIAAEVYSIEIVEPLGRQAADTLRRLGYDNVHLRIGDGYRGWPDEAPFDAILVTAAPRQIPEPLQQQLAVGGRMVIPVGEVFQELQVVTRTAAGLHERSVFSVRFVPMTGEADKRR